MNVLQNDKQSESKIIEQILKGYEENTIEDYKEALNKCNKYIEVKQESEAFRVRGIIHYQLKEKDKEFEDYNMAIQMDSKNDGKAYNSRGNRGFIYEHLKQYEKAIIDYNKVIELNPDAAEALNNRGIIHNIIPIKNTYQDMRRQLWIIIKLLSLNRNILMLSLIEV